MFSCIKNIVFAEIIIKEIISPSLNYDNMTSFMPLTPDWSDVCLYWPIEAGHQTCIGHDTLTNIALVLPWNCTNQEHFYNVWGYFMVQTDLIIFHL